MAPDEITQEPVPTDTVEAAADFAGIPVEDESRPEAVATVPAEAVVLNTPQLPDESASEATSAIPNEDDEDGTDKDKPPKYSGMHWPTGPNPHVLPVAPVFRAATAKEKEDPYAVSSIPSDAATFKSLLDAYPSFKYEVSPISRTWAEHIANASQLFHQGDTYRTTMDRDGSQWAQRVPYEARHIGILRPNLGTGKDSGAELSGDLAAIRTRMELGLGTATMVPLWHSGFWVTLRAPSAAARLELQQRINEEIVELGRMSSGLLFSNTSVYRKSYLVDFALAHVSTANVRYTAPLELKDKILTTDIPMLLWGLLTTLYPHGYPHHQPCINDPSKCQHVVHQMIDINKICFTDVQRLTEAQKKHMSTRADRKDDEAIERYRNDHAYINKGLFKLATPYGFIKMQLKIPTVTEYVTAGFEWVDGIVNTVQEAFGSKLQGEARNSYIIDQGKMLSMGEYSQYVKQIGFSDESYISDPETIRSTLGELSGDPEMTAQFFQAVLKYIEEATVATIALPRYNCPVCGTPSVSPEEAIHPYLAPIDVENLFFMMLAQHITKVLS